MRRECEEGEFIEVEVDSDPSLDAPPSSPVWTPSSLLPPRHHPHAPHCSEVLCHCRQLYAAPSICGSPATASEAAPSPELHPNAAGDAALIHPAYHLALDLVDAPLPMLV